MSGSELIRKGEDRHTTRQVNHQGETLFLGMVADGHGGKQCAELCKSCIFDLILGALEGPPDGTALRQAGTAAFIAMHERMLSDSSTTAGSTLTVCILNAMRGELTTLHCGDSVARLVGRRKTALALCEDHRLDSSVAERERVSKLGGKLARAMDKQGNPGGPLRLWPGSGAGVAQARAIGDRDVGHFIEARPYAQTVELPAGESCMVAICSDGIWDAMVPSAVDALLRGMISHPVDVGARTVCKSALATRHAYSSNGDEIPIDDTTVVLMRILDADDPRNKDNACICGSM